MSSRAGRARRRWLPPLLPLLLAALLAVPGAALGHAVPEASVPDPGAALEKAPRMVSFSFNEPVETGFGAVKVFDASGEEVQEGEPFRPDGDESSIAVGLPSALPDGAYTATYRVVSADSHPVSGGLVFTVGDPGRSSEKTISELLASEEAGPVTDVGFWLVRMAGYAAIALAVGAFAFAALSSGPVFRRRARERGAEAAGLEGMGARLRRLVLAAVLTGLAASLLALVFQGATAAGTDLWRAFDADVVREVVETRFGTVFAFRALAWLLLLPLAWVVAPLAAGRTTRGAGAAAALLLAPLAVLVVSPALAGHATTQGPTWALLPADAVHVAAMAVWGGGLACLLLALPAATRPLPPERRTALLVEVVTRFSTVALISVGALIVTGTVQTVIEVGSFPAMVESAFGRAVTAKIVVLAFLVGLGAANRNRIIPALVELARRLSPPGGPGLALRRNLRIELALIAAAIALAAALVAYAPPGDERAGPASGSVAVGADRLDYTVDPARVGANEVHLYLFDDRSGQPDRAVKGLELTFSKPEDGVAPIEAELEKAGPGHYVAPKAMLAIEGEWRAEVWVRFSRFEESSATFDVEVE